uniref:Ankyrin 3a n=1 Tax=Hucho hucho TaxID=62062 RepID=A0A4W5PZ57_9TELE
MAVFLCEDAMTGDTDKYLRPQDLKELGDDSLPQEGYMGFSIGVRSASLRSFSSDRSNTLNRSSYARDSMMIEEILAPTKDTHLAITRDYDAECLRRYSWTPDTIDHSNTVSSPIHSGFLVSFMVDARGGSMRGSRSNGMRIIIPPRKCTAPTRITCRLAKRHKLAYPPPMVEGEGLVSRLVEVGPAGAQFLGPVIVEIPHFGSMRGKERELIVLRSDNGDTWKEHQYDCHPSDITDILNGMDEELDSNVDLEKKRICRIITRDFPQYFAVVSRIKQESNHMGPEGGTLTSLTVPMVQASFPQGALTKKIRVGLQAQPVPDDMVRNLLGNRATFSPIVTVEPRRRKFHKPITMTIPVPPRSAEGHPSGPRGDSTPCLRLLCSITGGTSPAQWEDITGTTPLSFVTDCVSFTTNVSARFWLADCHQIPETVGLASQLYRELICVPYLAKFVVFAKMNDPVESRLRCFCMTDDKVDKTLEQQENFEEVARSKDIEVLEGKPIHVDCYGNLSPLIKSGQQLIFNFFSFKENRLPFNVKVRDMGQEPCGRLSFLKEPKTTKGLPQTAICNLNITLPTHKKTEKPDRRHTFASLALRKRYSYLTDPAASPQSPCERTDLRMAIVADHLGLSWTELAREMDFSVDEINHIRVENPNSLTAQSFMLLKKWVSRDGKNATTDALTGVLTKVNRMDIVTLLEGPIFDYGNISGTRSFADDNAVYLDQADDYHCILAELQSPVQLHSDPPFTELHSEPPTLTIDPTPVQLHPHPPTLILTQPEPWTDHTEPSVDPDTSTRATLRPCELSLSIHTLHLDPTAATNTGMAEGDQVLMVQVEEEKKEVDISLQQQEDSRQTGASEVVTEGEAEEEEEAEEVVKGGGEEGVEAGEMAEEGDKVVEAKIGAKVVEGGKVVVEGGMVAEEGAKVRVEGGKVGVDGGKVGLEGGKAVENGAKVVEEGGAYLSPQAWAEALGEQGVSGSTEEEDGDEDEKTEDKLKSLLEEGSEEEDEEMTEARVQEILSQVQQAEKDVCSLPGWHSDTSSVNVEPPTPGRSVSSDLLDRQENSQENSSDSITSSSRGEPARSRHNGDHTELPPQDGSLPVSQDSANGRTGHGKEEGTLVSEKKVQGEQAKNIPGESVTEEQFTDEDGNIITRKVIRKVIRRVSTPTPDDQGGDRGSWDRGDPWPCPFLLEEELEQGDGAKSRKEERRSGEKKLQS